MDPLPRIIALLEDSSGHKRIAAAVVLGELGAKDASVVAALSRMARDPMDAFAGPALTALGQLGSLKALPALLEALGRGGEVQKLASAAIAQLGPDALPEIRARMADAPPPVRAALGQLLPAVGGRLSFEMSLEGMLGQSFDVVNRTALTARQEVKSAPEAERKKLAAHVEKFLEKKKVQQDEAALRGALKVLGFLELPGPGEALLSYVGPRQSVPVRVEAITALRFAFGAGATKKALRRLIELLEDPDALISRAARDTLTVLKIGPDLADELARLSESRDLEVARWAIARLGGMPGKVAQDALFPVAAGADRARAEAAAKALAQLPGGEKLLATALARAKEEVGATVLAEVLAPLSRQLGKKELTALAQAGEKALADSLAVARKILEPVRDAEPERWAEVLRAKAGAALKKDPARAEALLGVLCRSSQATADDRYAFAALQLARSPKDPHPRARARDGALTELERLADDGLPLAKLLEKDKRLDDATRYYVGFHFVERPAPEARALGVTLLETLAARKNKLGKAAKNKLSLLSP